MATFRIMAEIDNKWMMILDQITKGQEGFIWEEVRRLDEDEMASYYVDQVKEETNG